jgi:hypothetical protein
MCVHKGEGGAYFSIEKGPEPTAGRKRQGGHISADGVNKDDEGEVIDKGVGAGLVGSGFISHPAQGIIEPGEESSVLVFEMDDRGQGGQEGIGFIRIKNKAATYQGGQRAASAEGHALVFEEMIGRKKFFDAHHGAVRIVTEAMARFVGDNGQITGGQSSEGIDAVELQEAPTVGDSIEPGRPIFNPDTPRCGESGWSCHKATQVHGVQNATEEIEVWRQERRFGVRRGVMLEQVTVMVHFVPWDGFKF